MQENHLKELITDSFKSSLLGGTRSGKTEDSKQVMEKMEQLSVKNKADLPDYLRTPTAEELVEMRSYAIEYKKNNKRASKREARKAVQEKFHIRIYK